MTKVGTALYNTHVIDTLLDIASSSHVDQDHGDSRLGRKSWDLMVCAAPVSGTHGFRPHLTALAQGSLF